MKNRVWRVLCLCLLLAACASFFSCTSENDGEDVTDETVILDMNADYALSETLPKGEGKRVKVILLLGQSNASGSSIVQYLEQTAPPRFCIKVPI